MKISEEFKVEVTRGTGPGGQHKNKVETCIKITHIPTGITETCQDTRSKLKNFELTKERIFNKIEKLKSEEMHEKFNEFRKSQINTQRRRTYNFQTNIVTDHITGKKANLHKILDGELDLLR